MNPEDITGKGCIFLFTNYTLLNDLLSLCRTLMYPHVYDPQMAQVFLLRCEYLSSTIKLQEKKTIDHYHGLRTTARGLGGHKMRLCPYCGKFYSYWSTKHKCDNRRSKTKCNLCWRYKVPKEEWDQYSPPSQSLFCVQDPDSDMKTIHSKCKKECADNLCLALHEQLCCKTECQKCGHLIRTDRGKYSLDPRKLTRKDGLIGHENCEEVFCRHCQTYVLGFYDTEKDVVKHTCFVERLHKTPEHPWGHGAFDLEVTTENEVRKKQKIVIMLE